MKNESKPSIGFLLTKIGRIVTKMYADRLELIDLTPLQAGVLGTAAVIENCNQRQLMKVLRADKGTIHQTLKSLEQRKLIKSTPSLEDKRHLNIQVTKAGLALLPKISAIDADVSAVVAGLMTAQMQKALEKGLEQIYHKAPLDL